MKIRNKIKTNISNFKSSLKIKDNLSMQMKTSLWIAYINLAYTSLDEAKKDKILERRRRSIIATIVFSAICLESFINESIIDCIENDKSLVSRGLPLHDKWRLVIQLINKKEVNKGSSIMGMINWLRKLRNELIHYQAEFEDLTEGKSTTSINQKLTIENAEKSFQIIKDAVAFFYQETKITPPDSIYGWKIVND